MRSKAMLNCLLILWDRAIIPDFEIGMIIARKCYKGDSDV